MKNCFLKVCLVVLLGMPQIIYAQAEGEPIKAPEEVPLGGFDGCTYEPPKNGCTARVKCRGVGMIFTPSAKDVQLATREAQNKARSALAMFYSTKQKAKESMVNASKSTGNTSADGSSSGSSSMERFVANFDETSAEEVLSGVQTLGRSVDMTLKTVTVKIGVSCQSQAAAAQQKATAARSANPSSANPSSANPGVAATPAAQDAQRQPPLNLKSFEQKTKNADDF